MKTRILKPILLLVGTAALLAGCATENRGALGNDTQVTYFEGSREVPQTTAANGSISRANPFGVGTGHGLTQ